MSLHAFGNKMFDGMFANLPRTELNNDIILFGVTTVPSIKSSFAVFEFIANIVFGFSIAFLTKSLIFSFNSSSDNENIDACVSAYLSIAVFILFFISAVNLLFSSALIIHM